MKVGGIHTPGTLANRGAEPILCIATSQGIDRLKGGRGNGAHSSDVGEY